MKDKLKKILHIITYILAFWGVISAIAFGLGSCILNNKGESSSSVHALYRHNVVDTTTHYFGTIRDTLPYSFVDELGNDGVHYISINDNANLVVNYGSYYFFSISLNNSFVAINNELNENSVDYIAYSFYHAVDAVFINNIYFHLSNDEDIYIFTRGVNDNKPLIDISIFFDYPVVSYDGTSPYHNFGALDFLSSFFVISISENVQYTFDTLTLNPIYYLSYEIMSDYTAHNTGSWTSTMDLNLTFVSNGLTFKKMRFQYDYVLGTYYNDTLTSYDNMTYLALTYIAYQDYYTDEWIKVCYPRIYKYETRTLNNVSALYGYPFTEFNSYLWANEGYKDITIISGAYNVYSTLVGDPVANLTNIQILSYQGDYNKNIYFNGSGDTNVFNLITYGFSSVMPLFSIGLLPGLTLGTLIFLPLVVVIIFAIIKLLRK